MWTGKISNGKLSFVKAKKRLTKDSISFTYDSSGRLIKQSNGLEFFYDNTSVAGVKYDNKTYVYRKDVQGNIIALLDSNGVVMVNMYTTVGETMALKWWTPLAKRWLISIRLDTEATISIRKPSCISLRRDIMILKSADLWRLMIFRIWMLE